MTRSSLLAMSIVGWAAVWAGWLVLTRSAHPTFALALVVTTALVAAYAVAAYVNHLVLIPRLLRRGRRWAYAAVLTGVMLGLTAVALGIIRASYLRTAGPDPDPSGALRHFAIDLVGMVVHVAMAALVVLVVRRMGGGGTGRTIRGSDPSILYHSSCCSSSRRPARPVAPSRRPVLRSSSASPPPSRFRAASRWWTGRCTSWPGDACAARAE